MESGQRLRCAFAIPKLDNSGPARVMFELLSHLDRERFQPIAITTEAGGVYFEALPGDVELCTLGIADNGGGRYPFLRLTRALGGLLPDIVVSTGRMTFAVALAARLTRHTFVHVVRQANDFTSNFDELIKRGRLKHRVARWLAVRTLQSADAIVCQSEAMRSDLKRVLGDDAKCRTIGNPIEPARVLACAAETAVTLQGSPAVVSVGRLAHQKGMDVLIDAFSEVHRHLPRATLTIVGDGEKREALQAQSVRLGIRDAVTFVGSVNNAVPWIAAADIFVLASRYEGFSNAVLEACALGKPIIVTDCPGANRWIVSEIGAGQLVPPDDHTAIVEKILGVSEQLGAIEPNGIRSACETAFGTFVILRRYEELFTMLTRGPQLRTTKAVF